jgi:hypothetical protein
LVLERFSHHDGLPIVVFKPSRGARESGFSLSAACAPSELRNDRDVPTIFVCRGAEYAVALSNSCLASRILIASRTRLYTRKPRLSRLQKLCNGLVANSGFGESWGYRSFGCLTF